MATFSALRGTSAARQDYDGTIKPLLKAGQFYWDTTQKSMFVGDGVETGGVPVLRTSTQMCRARTGTVISTPALATSANQNLITVADQEFCVPIILSAPCVPAQFLVRGGPGNTGTGGIKVALFSDWLGQPYELKHDFGVCSVLGGFNTNYVSSLTNTEVWGPGTYWLVGVTQNALINLASYPSSTSATLGYIESSMTKITYLHRAGSYGGGLASFTKTTTFTEATGSQPAFGLTF